MHVRDKLIAHACNKVGADTVLAFDITDIEKRYAKKMDFLASVWDGMERKKTSGYWVLEVAAADVDREHLIPLYSELYSQEADDFDSENSEILRAIDAVNRHTDGRGVWVMDRGGDRNLILQQLVRKMLRFIIRVQSRRTFLIEGHGEIKGSELASGISCKHTYTVEVDHQGYKEKHEVMIGTARVMIPGVEGIFYLVVVRGFGKDPILLLTNVEKDADVIVDMYLTRWKVEESIRFLKQEYELEDVRVRNYHSLKNTVVLLLAVFYFLSVHLGRKLKLNILLKKIYEKAKRFFQIPAFSQYALADGIYRILFDTKWRYSSAKNTFTIEAKQFLFPFAET